ncbi:hypothetical protein LEP1GSC070_3548 [Leptospira santarosai str. AIM]|nr:hypothetical protein LEP1GSC040_2983 [Leptospira santarosai str. 2000030832]EMO84987.1 hypothetical protein LEP1GSC070_3548 [Leptospira santarosai str. AIM]
MKVEEFRSGYCDVFLQRHKTFYNFGLISDEFDRIVSFKKDFVCELSLARFERNLKRGRFDKRL